MLRSRHYDYPWFVDERTERLNEGNSTLHLLLTSRNKSKNGNMGGLKGAEMVLGVALHWQVMAMWLPSQALPFL